jgi:hypothetical protein
MNIIYILLAMTLWGFVHSLTASLTLKEKIRPNLRQRIYAPVSFAV